MSTTDKTIKNYNKFAKDFDRGVADGFHHKYLEKPAMYGLLPDLKDKNVLCIGCGNGDEVNELTKRGARVIGIDISSDLIKIAKHKYPNLDFREMSMEDLDFSNQSFDFVYSSLALHHTGDLKSLLINIKSKLKNGGKLQFSITHPIVETFQTFRIGKTKFKGIGKITNTETKEKSFLGNYFSNRPMEIDWGNDFVVDFYHNNLPTIINSIIETGFALIGYYEPQPIPEAQKDYPEKFTEYSLYPCFSIFVCQK